MRPIFHYALPEYLQVELKEPVHRLNLEVFKREPSRVSSFGFLALGDALSLAGIDWMRAHQLLTTHPTRFIVCYQKGAAGQLII